MKQHSQNLGYWVKRYTSLINQTMDGVLKPYGLGRTQWYILFHIQQQGSLPQRALQTSLHIESATLTSLVASLVRKGLVAQQPNTIDKRSKDLVLTDKGKRVSETLPDPIEIVRAKALRGIKSKDIEKARKVIEAAVHNLEEAEI